MGSVAVYYGWSWTNQPTNQHKGTERRENIGGFISETPSRKQMATWVNWAEFNNRTIDKGVGEPRGQRREWFKKHGNLGGKCQLWFLGRQMGDKRPNLTALLSFQPLFSCWGSSLVQQEDRRELLPTLVHLQITKLGRRRVEGGGWTRGVTWAYPVQYTASRLQMANDVKQESLIWSFNQ